MILINPKSSNPLGEYKAIEPPIWCAMLAREGDTIIDNEVEDIPAINDDVLIVVMGNNPSVSSTPKIPEAIKLMQRFPQAKITGLHPMALDEATFQIPPPSELVKIKRAKWELLDMTKYRAHNWHCLHDLDSRGHYASLYTSFGCPFQCNFCNIHTIYKGRKVYYRNPQDVIDEIGLLATEYGVKNLKLCDELFTLNHKHVDTICDGIKGLHLNIWAYARVDTVTGNMLSKMKRAGISWLCYGFEAASNDVRKQSNKTFADSVAKKAIDMTRDSGINIMANFLFGLPGDTEDSMKANLDMAMRENFEYVNFYIALPYPGSEWYSNLMEKPSDWSGYSQFAENICADSRVVKFRDEAFNSYFSRPEYLSMIKAKFGDRAETHIKEMLRHKRGKG